MKKQSTVGGFAVLSTATLIVKILSLLYIPVLLAIISDYGFGIYSAANNIFVLIYAVTNSGLPSAISKLVSELTAVGNYKDALRAFRLTRTILISTGIVLSVVLFLSSRMLASATKYPQAAMAVAAISPTIFFSSITSTYRGYFQGRRNMYPTAISQVLEQVVNLTFTITLAYMLLNKGVEYACAGGTFATAIAAMAASMYLFLTYRKNKEYRIYKLHNPEAERHTTKELILKIVHYSVPLTLCVALQYAGNLVDMWNTKSRLIFAGFDEKTATELFSFLSKYTQLINVPNSVITSLAVALMPTIAAAYALRSHNEVRENVNMAFRICFMISIPSAVGLSFLSTAIFQSLKIRGGSYLMYYGSFAVILMSCVQIFNTILQGVGKLYVVIFFLLAGITAKILTNYYLIGIYSINILGAIAGNYLYFLIPLVLHVIFINKFLKIRVNLFKHALKPLEASIVMGAAVYICYNLLHLGIMYLNDGYISYALPLAISVFVGMYVYIYSLALFKGITQRDIETLPSRARRMIPSSIRKKIEAQEA